MKYIIVSLFIASAAFTVQAQTPTYYTDILTEKQGLSSNKITCIMQDRTGFLWVGTPHGLNRYDGGKFKIFVHNHTDSSSICGNLISAIAEDQDGLIWIATWGGLAYYNPKNGTIKNFRNEAFNPRSLPTNKLLFVHVDKHNQVWVSVANFGLSLYNRASGDFTTFAIQPFQKPIHTKDENAKNRLLRVSEDKEDNLWLLPHSAEGFLFKFSTQSHAVERINIPRLNSKLDEHLPSAILTLDAENIWVGTWGGLRHYNTKTNAWKNYLHDPVKRTYLTNIIFCITKSDANHLIIGSSKGYGTFNIINHQFNFLDTTYKKEWTEFLIEGNEKAQVYIDRQGIQWRITQEGLAKLDPLSHKFKSLKLPLNGSVSMIYKDTAEHLLLISTSYKNIYFTIYDERRESYTNVTTIKGISFNYCLPLGNKRYLLSANGGELYIFNLTDKTLVPFFNSRYEPICRKKIFNKLILDKRGHIWGNIMNGGMCKIDTTQASVEFFTYQPNNINAIKSPNIFDIYEDREGRIWILYEQQGISIYDPYKKQMVHYENTPQNPRILPSQPIANIVSDAQGNYWMPGYEGGICKYNGINAKQPFTIIKNLPADNFFHIEADRNNHLWITSNTGLLDYNIQSGKTKQYLIQDGLPHNFLDDKLITTNDGEMLLCYDNEILRFYPGKLISNPYSPKPVITSFKVFDKEHNIIYHANGSQSCELPYDQNFISFEFAGLNFSNPQGNSFAYMMEGIDKDWVYCGNRQYASYTNLKGGKYKFKVKSANSDGFWNNEIAEFNLIITPPFWETWWFIFTILSILFLSIYIFMRNRIKQVKMRESLKSRMIELESQALRSQMNPHFIFNSLNSIQHYILNNDRVTSSKYLTKFSKLIRLILENSQVQKISLANELQALDLYIQLEQYRYENKFEYTISVDSNIYVNDVSVPPLILQPYVENAIWHGFMHKVGKGKLQITIKQDAENLLCIIEDDGIGREEAAKYKSMNKEEHKSTAMRVTQDRLELLNKANQNKVLITIIDIENKKGTRVEIRIPLL